MIAAARNGDEEAMENLTMEEMDTYSMISNRIVHEDILSIVDSYFMPYGIQCDQYSILGEIIEYHTVQNNITDVIESKNGLHGWYYVKIASSCMIIRMTRMRIPGMNLFPMMQAGGLFPMER